MIGRLIRREIRKEFREGFTELVLAGIDSRVSGADVDALTTGPVEICANLWGRVLAAARVEGTDALTGRVRHRIGRDLIRVGESSSRFAPRTGGSPWSPLVSGTCSKATATGSTSTRRRAS